VHFATCIAIYVLLLNPLRLIYYKNPLQWWYTCDFIYSDSKDKKKIERWTDFDIWLQYLAITLLRPSSIKISAVSDFIRNAVLRDILLHTMNFDKLSDRTRGLWSDRRSYLHRLYHGKTWYRSIHFPCEMGVFTEEEWIPHDLFILVRGLPCDLS